MTSSETPTESSTQAGEGLLDRLAGRLDRVIFGGVLAVGCVAIFYVNGWRWSAPVFFLLTGWLGILISGHFLWKTAMVAAAEGEDDDDDGFEVASTRRDDLVREKRAVLKAIKEIEFDHAMDKMSKRDADELLAIYRRRAIAIIKELEGGEGGSVSELIDREVKARLAVDSAASGAVGKAEKTRKKQQARRSANSGAANADRGGAVDETAGDHARDATSEAAGDARAEKDAASDGAEAVGDEARARDEERAKEPADGESEERAPARASAEAAGGRSGA